MCEARRMPTQQEFQSGILADLQILKAIKVDLANPDRLREAAQRISDRHTRKVTLNAINRAIEILMPQQKIIL